MVANESGDAGAIVITDIVISGIVISRLYCSSEALKNYLVATK